MKTKEPKLLKLDIQFFSEEQVDEKPAEAQKTDTNEVDNKIPYDRFKQKVDEANELKRKLAELETAKQEAERKKLEEQNEFKSLYEQTKEELERIRKDAETTKLESIKTNLLVNAGYTGEQLERVRKYIVGADEDALKASLEELKQDIPPKVGGVDPSVSNPQRQQPQPKDQADEGRSLYERLKAAGKIRR